jgi:bleomycin hydrolase
MEKSMRSLSSTCFVIALALVMPAALTSQPVRTDRAVFLVPRNEFLDSIRKDIGSFNAKPAQEVKKIRMDFSGLDIPQDTAGFTTFWHNPPVSQGMSGMCWAFSTVSFFESEIHRLTNRNIRLSELYTVYWEYVEKARRFVQERGNSAFGQGSEADAVVRIWRMYGIVPAEAYTAKKPGQHFHDHDPVFQEMETYLQSVKAANAWNEEAVLATIRSILNSRIGEPPATVVVDGKSMTPKEYLRSVVRLKLDDYISFLSLAGLPYYTRVEYTVPDNWWHDADFYNIPLDDYMAIIRNAIRKGYTVALGGDTSEPGYDGHAGVAMVPSFDIPSAFIDEHARALRFANGTSTDDHGIHLIGYRTIGGADWYLIKDSGSGSRNNSHPGYYFFHQDYVKLKILDFMVHRDVAADVLAKFSH